MSANTQLTNSQDVTGHVGHHVSQYVDWGSVNISINRPPTFSQYFDDTWLTLLLELHFLHVSSNFCRFHWQGIDLSNVKKLSAQFFLQTFLCMSCMLHKKICILAWLRRHRVREDMNSDLWSDFLSGWLCWTFSDLLSVLTFQFWNYVVGWSIATNIPPTVNRYSANIWHLPYHRYFNLVSTDTWSCRPTLNSVSVYMSINISADKWVDMTTKY